MRMLSGTFCGTQVARRQVAGLHIVESVYEPHQMLPWHAHQWPYFTFVLRGAYSEQCEGKTWELAEGDFVVHGAGESHADRIHGGECCILNIELTQPWLDRIGAFGANLDARVTSRGGYVLQLGNRLHRELWSDERISALCIEGLTLEVIAEVAKRKLTTPGNPRWLQHALDYLRAHFTHSPSLHEVAAAVGVHPVHLAREFRRKQGVTVGGYLRKLRVELAAAELVASRQPIVDIAIQAGFSDHSHMTRVFRRETGLTPTEFRNLRGHAERTPDCRPAR